MNVQVLVRVIQMAAQRVVGIEAEVDYFAEDASAACYLDYRPVPSGAAAAAAAAGVPRRARLAAGATEDEAGARREPAPAYRF